MKIIVANDGGGGKGRVGGFIIDAIEQETGKRFADCVDLMSGTSAGAINTLLLAHPRKNYSGKSIIDFYQDRIPKIFRTGFFRSIYTVGTAGIISSKYDGKELRNSLKELVGDYKLGESKLPIVIQTYERFSENPEFMKSFRDFWKDFPADLAAVASSSAPYYFPSLEVEYGGYHSLFSDAGLYINNPTFSALVDAVWLWGPKEDYVVINIGTASKPNPERLTSKPSRSIGYNGGAIFRLADIIKCAMEGSASTVQVQAETLMSIPSSTVKYIRFDVPLEKDIPMDSTNKRDNQYLDSETLKYLRTPYAQKEIDFLCEILTERSPQTLANRFGSR